MSGVPREVVKMYKESIRNLQTDLREAREIIALHRESTQKIARALGMRGQHDVDKLVREIEGLRDVRKREKTQPRRNEKKT